MHDSSLNLTQRAFFMSEATISLKAYLAYIPRDAPIKYVFCEHEREDMNSALESYMSGSSMKQKHF